MRGSSACLAAVHSQSITRLSVKRLEFIRDTESRWQLPTDLTCVHKRRWSDPLGGYRPVNKDIVSLERREMGCEKNEQEHSEIREKKEKKTACGMRKVCTESQARWNWGEYIAFLLLLQVVRGLWNTGKWIEPGGHLAVHRKDQKWLRRHLNPNRSQSEVS